MSPLVILLLLPMTILVNQSQYDYIPENYSFYDNICVMDRCNIHIFIVDSWTDFPAERCQDKNVRGCSIFGPMIDDYIYLRMPQYVDEFGMKTFEHESAHIICQCNFHLTAELRTVLVDIPDVFNFIVEYK